MPILNPEINEFLLRQNFTIVTSIDPDGGPHSSCKGIVKIIPSQDIIYLMDLYKKNTHANIMRNGMICLTAVEEHGFKGYCLKGRAEIVAKESFSPELIRSWEDKIAARSAQRLIVNLGGKKGHPSHPELMLPEPEYMIMMRVCAIVDLSPVNQ